MSHSLSYSHHHHTIFSLFTLFFSLLSSYSHIHIQKIHTLQSNAPQHPSKISLYFPISVDLNHPGSQKNRILISGSCCLLHLGTPKRFFFCRVSGCWLRKMGSGGSKARSSSSSSGSFRKGRSKGHRGFPSYCLGTSSGSRDIDSDDQVILTSLVFQTFSHPFQCYVN